MLARHPGEPLLLEALPARRPEEAHREGERLVVEQADEGAEEAVEEADVPPSVHHLEHVAQVLALPLLLLGDEPVAEGGEKEAMPEVAEHDAEEVRKEDAGEGARVDFAVPWRAVRVDERLEAAGEGVGRDVRRRRELGLDKIDDGARVEPLRHGGPLEGGYHCLVLIRRHPSLGDEDGALEVELALVERVVHHLLARDDVRPRAVRCGERGEGAAKDCRRLLEHLCRLRLALLHLERHRGVVERGGRVLVEGGAEVRGDLGDLVAEDSAREEDHEEGLLHELRGLARRVEELRLDCLLLEDGVAARGAEDNALERGDGFGFDHAGQHGEHGGGLAAELGEGEEGGGHVRLGRGGGGAGLVKLFAHLEDNRLLVEGVVVALEEGLRRLERLHLNLGRAELGVDSLEGREGGVGRAAGGGGDARLDELLLDGAQDPLQVVALAHLVDEAALEEGLARVEVAELHHAELAELGDDGVRCPVLHHQLDQRHLLRAP
mmetsp:Transcript_42647/g.141904  ORF Transcript_42647/g.141904 Transcript_42647/m.141904 type:complete len:493 (+) Transcript_42647:1450-2928(+)